MNLYGLRMFSALVWKELKEARVKFLTALVAFLLLGLFGVLLLYWLPDLLPPEILIPIHFTPAEAFQKILEIGEGYQLAEAHLNIGYCYEKMGKKELLSV
jgi:hypothetical protein